METDFQAVIAAPFGNLALRVEHGALIGLEFVGLELPLQDSADDVVQAICRRLTSYLDGVDLELDLPCNPRGTDFQRRVWQALRAIPAGGTITYGELARRVGSGPRAVANACGANPIALVIPCHRVVARHGLGGFMQGHKTASLAIKQWLLTHERSRSAAA